MPIIDTGTVPAEAAQTPAEGAYEIRQIFARQNQQLKRQLTRVNGVVGLHSRSSIAAELGADAAELLALYNSAKAHAELGDAAYTVDDLP